MYCLNFSDLQKFIHCEKAIKFDKILLRVMAFSDYQNLIDSNSFPFSHIEGSSDANYHLRKLEAWVFLDNKMVKFSHYPALCSCNVCAPRVMRVGSDTIGTPFS